MFALVAILLAGGMLRFYGLSWGAPYFHFHIDEHFVFVGADLLRADPGKAALSPKFFMYSPLPMYALIAVLGVFERAAGALDLARMQDQVTLMLLGRGISALLGTATIPLLYFVGARIAGRTAGLLAALFFACSVLSLRDAHFFTVDTSLVFFCVLTWAFMFLMAESGRRSTYIAAGVSLGAALLCKYTALFLVPALLVAHACSPHRPRAWRPVWAWWRWARHATVPPLLGVLTFLALNPLSWLHFGKFRQDIQEQVTGPLLGSLQPIWNAHFRDIQPQLFWFTNLLPWGVGPALTIWGLGGIAWLLWRRDRAAVIAVAYPLAHYAVAGQTVTPFARYALPLIPGIAVAAGVFSADLVARPRWRRAALVATGLVAGTTVLYALAYVSIYRQPDVRLQASKYLLDVVPRGSSILVEPSHNVPPTGSYLTAVNFYEDYVGWGPQTTRTDYYRLHTLDVYKYLYDNAVPPPAKRRYIETRLALVDYILIDEWFMDIYAHLPQPEHQVVRRYYEDLFSGRLRFKLLKAFEVRPSLFGHSINDDPSELTFTLFDHPKIYIFKREAAAATDTTTGR